MSDPKQKSEPKQEVQPQLQAATQQQVVDIASAVSKSTLEAILPSLLEALSKGQTPAPQPSQKRHKSLYSRPKCSECGWFLKDGEKEHKHEMVVVYPTKSPEFGDEFVAHGIMISGVKFCSVNEHHEIPVPLGMKSVLLGAVQAWEQAERELRNGKDKRRRGPSARVSPGGVATNPIDASSPIGWQ